VAQVCLVWALDTLHLILVVYTVWYYLVANYFNPAALVHVVWAFAIQIIVSSFLAIVVQYVYAFRLYRITKRPLVTLTIVVSAIIYFAFDLYFVVKVLEIGDLDGIIGLAWSTTVALAFSVFADLLICFDLCHYLSKSRTGFSHTDTMINKLMLYAVNTGLLTSIFTLLSSVLFATSFTFVAAAVYFVLSKLYTNSLLAMLNSRKRIRVIGNSEMHSFHMSKVRGVMTDSTQKRSDNMHIQVSVACDTVRDRPLGSTSSIDQTKDMEAGVPIPLTG